jgi:hypothetical protein
VPPDVCVGVSNIYQDFDGWRIFHESALRVPFPG